MGIEKLLKNISDYLIKSNLREYENMRIGFDAYVLLHKSIYSGNLKMAFGEDNLCFLQYFDKLLNRLLNVWKVIPIFIFDGNKLPMKSKTENNREYKRDEKIKKAYELLDSGCVYEAKMKYISSIDITPEMTFELIKLLDVYKIQYIVAPYEADAQLAYLQKIKYIDYICTEDSDLIAYGCKKIIYKLDNKTGNCKLYLRDKLFKNKKSIFYNWDKNTFLEYCILCGCDYFKIPGVSCKTAYRIVSNKESIFKDKKYNEYEEIFIKTFNLFRFHIVYCPIENRFRTFKKIKNNDPIPDYIGKIETDPTIIELIITGYINPINYNLII